MPNVILSSLITLPAILIPTPSSLPAGTTGIAYSALLTATGGLAPYTWSLVSATPNTGGWISLGASSGIISGTPTKAESESISVRVTDSVGNTTTKTFSMTIASNLAISTSSPLPGATTGTLYSTTIAASGGSGAYTWSITSNTPNTGGWSSINASTGAISGTPGTAETESIVVKVTDAAGNTASKTFALVVAAAATTTLLSFMKAQVGSKYFVGQTVNQYNDPSDGSQFVDPTLLPVSGSTYPSVANFFTASAPNGGPNEAGWWGPYLPDVVSHVTANGIPQFTFTPDNPAGSGTTGPSGGNGDGGSDIADNPNPVSGGNPTSSSVIYNAANIINGSSTSYNLYQQHFFAYIDWCCVNVYAHIKDSSGNNRPWLFCLPGEFNDSRQWWNVIDNSGGHTTFFTLDQYASLCKLIVWRMVKINSLSGFLVCLEPGTEFPVGVTAGAIAAVASALKTGDSTFPNGYVDAIGADINSIETFDPSNGGASTYAALQATGLLNLGFLSIGWGSSSTDNYNNIWLPMISAYPDDCLQCYFSQVAALTAGTNANLIVEASNAITRGNMPMLTQAGGVVGG